MKSRILFSLTLCLVLLIIAFVPGQAQGPSLQDWVDYSFNYSGTLYRNGSPYTGMCDFMFVLWPSPTGGDWWQIEDVIRDVLVTRGLFTFRLDFGEGMYNGEPLFMEARVRCLQWDTTYVPLSPRLQLGNFPMAINSLKLNGQRIEFFQQRVAGTCPAGSSIREINADGTVACETDDGGSGGSGWLLAGNAGTAAGANFVGTTDNVALEFKVNGARALRLEPNATSPNVIGGYSGNTIAAGAVGATIAGGGASTGTNYANDEYGVVGGGSSNTVGNMGMITTDAGWATIAGGRYNKAASTYATVGGGTGNTAGRYESPGFGDAATVGGGAQNEASGKYGTVPGGAYNLAKGDYSFAAGRRAEANVAGCFVWADSTDADFACDTTNLFAVRAGGGVQFVTGGEGATIDGNKVWNAGNDGAGSGLDADLLDGNDTAFFQQRVAGTCATGSSIREINADGTVACEADDGGSGGSGWLLAGNAGTTPGTNFVGTTDNQALEFKVNGSRALRLEPHDISPNVIGGSRVNSVTTGAYGATVAGGEANRVTDDYGVVGGGNLNQAGDGAGSTSDTRWATVGGGYSNSARGQYATVGGGFGNQATGARAAVGGGIGNAATQSTATVGGGNLNTASGESATVPGGAGNLAQGDYSLAAGKRAKANSTGCFVWADSTEADFACNVANQFAVRATGGLSLTVDTAGGGLRIVPNATSPNLTGGYSGNFVAAGAYGAAIGGGGASGNLNRVTDNYGVVGGGSYNQAGNDAGATGDAAFATVGGGYHNTASANTATVGGGTGNTASNDSATTSGGSLNTASGAWATVGGGYDNDASGGGASVGGGYGNHATASYATVGGGSENNATGENAAVGGGRNNVASGKRATVPGGEANTAQGDSSFAAGTRAKANSAGCFVWADSAAADFACNTTNLFAVRAGGGVQFVTSGAGATIDGNKVWNAGNDGTGSGLDADLLDGQHGPFYQNAGNLNAGTVSNDRFSAFADLGAEGYLGNAAGDLAQNNGTLQATLNADLLDGQHASAFASASHDHNTAYWKLTGNGGTTPGANFLGTTDNQALEVRVNNQRALRVEPNGTSPNVIAGYSGNSVTAGVFGAAIGGGGSSGSLNRVTDNSGTVGGGINNQAGNNAGTTDDARQATVAGGVSNTASGAAATVGGGFNNIASGFIATVGGGANNIASGSTATVPGGDWNTAQGDFSFAAGRKAKATAAGCFAWGDSTDSEVSCKVANRWVARASGGVYFYTDSMQTTGVYVAAGGGSWSSVSDRSLKANFASVDGQDVLRKLAGIPINTWNYKSQDAVIRHIGPVAQDFYAAFGVGEDSTHITTVDADGVALAAIQGLYAENIALRQQVSDLESRMAALEALVAQLVQGQQGGAR